MNKDYDYLEQYHQNGGTYVLPVEVVNNLLGELEDLKQIEKNTYESSQDMLSELSEENQQYKQKEENLIKYLEDKIKNLSQMTAQFIQIGAKVTSIPEIKAIAYQDILERVKSGKYE